MNEACNARNWVSFCNLRGA